MYTYDSPNPASCAARYCALLHDDSAGCCVDCHISGSSKEGGHVCRTTCADTMALGGRVDTDQHYVCLSDGVNAGSREEKVRLSCIAILVRTAAISWQSYHV